MDDRRLASFSGLGADCVRLMRSIRRCFCRIRFFIATSACAWRSYQRLVRSLCMCTPTVSNRCGYCDHAPWRVPHASPGCRCQSSMSTHRHPVSDCPSHTSPRHAALNEELRARTHTQSCVENRDCKAPPWVSNIQLPCGKPRLGSVLDLKASLIAAVCERSKSILRCARAHKTDMNNGFQCSGATHTAPHTAGPSAVVPGDFGFDEEVNPRVGPLVLDSESGCVSPVFGGTVCSVAYDVLASLDDGRKGWQNVGDLTAAPAEQQLSGTAASRAS